MQDNVSDFPKWPFLLYFSCTCAYLIPHTHFFHILEWTDMYHSIESTFPVATHEQSCPQPKTADSQVSCILRRAASHWDQTPSSRVYEEPRHFSFIQYTFIRYLLCLDTGDATICQSSCPDVVHSLMVSGWGRKGPCPRWDWRWPWGALGLPFEEIGVLAVKGDWHLVSQPAARWTGWPCRPTEYH